MRAYKIVLQCQECKKVYTSYWDMIYEVKSQRLCPKCGTMGKIKAVVARPKLFRLGWEVKEEEDER